MAAEMAERIGARVRARREELGLTQAEVARRMPGTTTSDQLSRWERGKHQPQNLDSLAEALEVDVSYFYAPAPASTETPDLFPPMETPDRLARLERQLGEFKSEVLDELAGVREELRKAFNGRTEQGADIIDRLDALEESVNRQAERQTTRAIAAAVEKIGSEFAARQAAEDGQAEPTPKARTTQRRRSRTA